MAACVRISSFCPSPRKRRICKRIVTTCKMPIFPQPVEKDASPGQIVRRYPIQNLQADGSWNQGWYPKTLYLPSSLTTYVAVL